MRLVLIVLLAVHLVETKMCGFSLFTLFLLVPRCMFACRLMGRIFTTKTLCTLEGVGMLLWVIWRVAITRHCTWISFIALCACGGVCCLIYAHDNASWVYIDKEVD